MTHNRLHEVILFVISTLRQYIDLYVVPIPAVKDTWRFMRIISAK